MATEHMAQMFAQLLQLSQQLVNQQQMFQQSLEVQRQQSQAQMETLTNLGAAQVAKTTYDSRDFQIKAFSKLLCWIGQDKDDQPISESDIQQVAAEENRVDMVNFNMQLHGDLVSLMEERTEGFDIVRNTKAGVGLDAWRRLNQAVTWRTSGNQYTRCAQRCSETPFASPVYSFP